MPPTKKDSATQQKRVIQTSVYAHRFALFEAAHGVSSLLDHVRADIQSTLTDFPTPRLPTQPPFPDDWALDPRTLRREIVKFVYLHSKIADYISQPSHHDQTPLRPGQNPKLVFDNAPLLTPFPPSLEPESERGLASSPVRGPQRRTPSPIMLEITMSEQQLEQIIARAVHTALANHAPIPGPQGPPGPSGLNAAAASHWKAEEIGYFVPDPTSTIHIKTIRGITHYVNVFAFLTQLRAMVPLKSEETVRANLPSCLREQAAEWYNTELSSDQRFTLNMTPLEEGWYAILEKSFKMRPVTAQARLMAPESQFGWNELRSGKSPVQWARTLMRDAQAADFNTTVSQLRMVWMRLDPNLQRDLEPPNDTTTVAEFMDRLELRGEQWAAMAESRA
ncbi:hypothetical protein N7495_002421 [Penicillium taxi]|uniref:uncharacterized protein n=1 Tax=Penicillium taxi TaxID=168475 RepID=UPI002545555D|nr:uncharacterized protein N7495_002421 [Penicillium taxi]KAJ5901893.1 hypothetical protein N7495_002421 [Penicillium taxi]